VICTFFIIPLSFLEEYFADPSLKAQIKKIVWHEDEIPPGAKNEKNSLKSG
jgi:hypothetical protein